MTHLNSEKKMMNSNQESILAQVSVEELCRKLDAYWEGGEKAEAFPYYQKTAEQGHRGALFGLSRCGKMGMVAVLMSVVCGFGCHKQETAAEKDFQRALIYWVEADEEIAFLYYKRAAEQGHGCAQYGLGNCYALGRGTEQDMQQAVYWFRKAAKQGHPVAQYSLGVCYAEGVGVKQDMQKAVSWYRKSAEQEYPKAQFVLGLYYDGGGGVVEQDWQEAVSWYRKAAEQGYPGAQLFLGQCYALGRGVEQDWQEATSWWRKAAELGYPRAIEALKEVGQ